MSELPSLLHERPGCNQIVGRHFLSALGVNLNNWQIYEGIKITQPAADKNCSLNLWLIFYNELLSFKYWCLFHHLMKTH